MATGKLNSSDGAARIHEQTIGQISFIRYADGDILFHGKGSEGVYDPDKSIVLAPPQLGVIARKWSNDSQESIGLGTDDLDRPATLSRTAGTVEMKNPEVSVELPAEAVDEIVGKLRDWNYHLYKPHGSETLELDSDHVESLLKFTWEHHPRNSTGWVGDIAEAMVDIHTKLHEDQIAIEREPLEILLESVTEESGTVHPTTDGAAKDIQRSLADFGSDVVTAGQSELKQLVKRVEEDTAFDRDSADSDVSNALAEVKSALKE